MKLTKHPLAARSVVAFCLVLGAGGGAPSAAAASCKAIVPGIGCFKNLHALCGAVDGAAAPPAAPGDKEAMISTVVGVSKHIRQADLEQAIKDMDGFRQKFDRLRYAATTKISDADSEKIGIALSAASLCIDGLN